MEVTMKKIITLVGFAMLLASPAFGQAADGGATTLSGQANVGRCDVNACGGYGSGNIIFPNNPSAAAAAGASSTMFLGAPSGAPSGAAGAFAYEPKPAPSTGQECAQRFKSYDPRSGTYLGRDGYRHACP